MLDEKQKLENIINLGYEIAQIKDVDLLLEMILTRAREFVNADAGSIYVREGDKLKFSYTQNETMRGRLQEGKKLIYSTFSIPINHNSIAGYVASTGEVLNIADAYEISEGAPYCFDRQYDYLSEYRTRSMLTFPLMTSRGKTVGVLQLINAMDEAGGIIPFLKSDEPLLMNFAFNASVALERAQMTRAMILRMIRMAELRDPKETGGHVNRVAAYAVEIYETWANKKGLMRDVINRNRDILRMAAMLHDVGKIAISDKILKKPARLDPDEIEVMQQHTFLGARLFSDTFTEFDEAAALVALNHHEKWDGSGYPGHVNPVSGQPIPGYEKANGKAIGKKADEIPPFGRVVAIADVYDALSCRRVYKEPWDEGKVFETLRTDSGTHFDPEMVDAFFDSVEMLRSIAQRYPD